MDYVIFWTAFFVLLMFAQQGRTDLTTPNLYWNFDETCPGRDICVTPTIPDGRTDYNLRTLSSVSYDPYIPGVVKKGLLLDSKISSDGIFTGDDKCITSVKVCTEFTIAFWLQVNPDSNPQIGSILRTSSTDGTTKKPLQPGISIVLNVAQGLAFYLQANNVFYLKISSTPFNLSDWVHVVVVWTENEHLQVYINTTRDEGLHDKQDITDPLAESNELTLGDSPISISIDELKVWYEAFPEENITEIFRLSLPGEEEETTTEEPTTTPDPTTTMATTTTEATTVSITTTTQETTTDDPTTTTTTTTTETSTGIITTTMQGTTDAVTTRPIYIKNVIEELKNVSEELWKTQQANEDITPKSGEEIEEATEQIVNTTTSLTETIKNEDVQLTTELAISYISGVSAITSGLVAPENSETWQEVPEKTKMLNNIIEAADEATEVLIDSLPPENITEYEIVKKDTFIVAFVPQSTTMSQVMIAPSDNVQVALSVGAVEGLSRNEPVVLAANIYPGANDCYKTIPADEIDIIIQVTSNVDSQDVPKYDAGLPLLIVTEIVSVNIRPELDGQVVSLSFKHIEPLNESTNFTLFCAYINKTTKKWTNEFCSIITTNFTHTTIETPHLTNFAILMQVVDIEISESHLKNLSLITYIGSAISIFCLVLSLCVFALVNNVRGHRTERYHVHGNLALSILLGQVTFLVGAGNEPGTDACKATAILLHFFYMSAFSWMLVEGLHLYNLVVKVFRSASSRLGYYYMIGWGTPLLICVISVAAAFGGYGENKNCWLDMDNSRVIWAFVGPALFVIVVNIFILIKVTRIITNLAKSQENCINCLTDRATIVVCAKAIAVLLPILGVTWVIGIFAVNEDTIVFQYIFAVCNSLQGFFLFLFHCVFNSETRSSLRYRTKSLRTEMNSRSITNSRSRRPTKVELVRHAENVSDDGGVDTVSTAFNTNNNRTQVTPYGTPMSSRETSRVSSYSPMKARKGFKPLQGENAPERPSSVNSGRFSATSRKVDPSVSTAW